MSHCYSTHKGRILKGPGATDEMLPSFIFNPHFVDKLPLSHPSLVIEGTCQGQLMPRNDGEVTYKRVRTVYRGYDLALFSPNCGYSYK